MKVGLLYKLLCGVWAIRPEAAEAYLPLVAQVISGTRPQAFDDDSAPATPRTEAELMADSGICFVTRDGQVVHSRDAQQLDPSTRGLVAVLPVNGPVMMDDYCGDVGTRTMSRWMRDFDSDPAIDASVLVLDTPGGDGVAMFQMADTMGKLTKPVVGMTEFGMACSAGYGIGSACRELYAGNGVDELGSIGTYVTLYDWSKMLEKYGINVHSVYATKSTEKNADVREALKADPKNEKDAHYDKLRKGYIDPFNERFIGMVKKNRPQLKDADGSFAGAVFDGDKAFSLGMVDGVGRTLEQVVEAARDLAKKNNTNT